MLVLSRKSGEAITIGPNVTIRLISVTNGRVRLGIEAPREVGVSRPDCRNPRPTQQAAPADRLPKPVSL